MSFQEQQKVRAAGSNSELNISDTIPSFLLKTYQILENEKYEDIICWTKSGEGFIVKRIKQFADNVLPIYFRHSNYTSFVRQLNMYDFHKTRQENHENAFKNVMFKRGYKHLLKDIQRKDYKKNKENTKEPMAIEKNTMYERPKDIIKSMRPVETINDTTFIAVSKLAELNGDLEKKALILASLREMPSKELQIIRLLDVLFDAKRIQREMMEKMTLLENISLESIKPAQKGPTLAKTDKIEGKSECPTTEGKTSVFESSKEDKLATYSTLFSSFRVA